MSPAPRLGRSVFNKLDLSPAELEARKSAGVDLDAPLTEAEIANRNRDKQSILAGLNVAAPAIEKQAAVADGNNKIPLVDLVRSFVASGNSYDEAEAERQRQEAERAGRALVTEAKSLETRLGQIRSKWMTRIATACSIDTEALLRSVPQKLEQMQRTDGTPMLVETAHRSIRRFQEAARNARDAVGSTLGGPQGREIKPQSLAFAAAQVEDALTMRTTHTWAKNNDGTVAFVLAAGYKGAVVALEWWLVKSRPIVVAAERSVQQLQLAEDRLRALLAEVGEPHAAAPTTPRIGIAPLPEPPAPHGTDSIQGNFDVFSVGR